MKRLVKITDQKHELFGQIVPGGRIYYDIHHTGDSPDLFHVEHEGKTYRLLSTQIDEQHYETQLLAETLAQLGANVGDVVVITETGSGSYAHGWDGSKPHKITEIGSGGQVEFDGGSNNGGASMFRPKVRLASELERMGDSRCAETTAQENNLQATA